MVIDSSAGRNSNEEGPPLDAKSRNYILRHWEFVAATAWAGYQKQGRGVVVIQLERQFNERGELTRVDYMTAGMDGDEELVTEFIFNYADNLMPGGVWEKIVRDYDYNREVVVVIEHEDDKLPTIHQVQCGNYMPSPQEAFTLLSGRGLFTEKEGGNGKK